MTTASRTVTACATVALLLVPGRAFAQEDKTVVEIAPLYLWAARVTGHVALDDQSVPIFMDFKNAAKKLTGAFTVHAEVRRGRWGVLSDVNFVRLSTSTSFTTPILGLPVAGTAKEDATIFEAGVSYLVKPGTNFSLIGGLRTYTLSPRYEFAATDPPLPAVDGSGTAVGVFGGFMYRPKLSDKVAFLSRADVGGGEAFSWSATLGFDFRFKPWLGAFVGYRGLGIDTGNVPRNGTVVKNLQYALTQYGPAASLTFRWKQK